MFRKKPKICKLSSFLLTLVLLVLSFSLIPPMSFVQETFAQGTNWALTGTPSHANQQAGANNYLVWTWQDIKLNDNLTSDIAHGVVVSNQARFSTWASFDSIINFPSPVAQLDKIEVVFGLYGGNQVAQFKAYVYSGGSWNPAGDTGIFVIPRTGILSFTTGAPWSNVQGIKIYSYSLTSGWAYVDYRIYEIRAFGPAAPSFQDIGLRVQTPGGIVSIAAEIGVPTSPLRIAKDGVVYGIALVNPGDVNDSGVRIQLASGEIKALRKL